MTLDFAKRPRRLRRTPAIRALVQETYLRPCHFVAPLFVVEGTKQKTALSSLPYVHRFSIDMLLHEIEELAQAGIQTINLFCATPNEKKDAVGSEAVRQGNLLQTASKAIKKAFPEITLMADIALDPFTDHGHDGLVEDGKIVNDASVKVLGEMALRAAEAGVDFVSPSDMMDGRVGYMRTLLDRHGHTDVGIVSYAAKYASAFYGPFREALDSAPKFGDKKSYQMNPANCREALRECALDEEEGADMLLIKPATTCLDIIAKLRETTDLPIAAYYVSGEIAMIEAAAQKGYLDRERALLEVHLSIKRAGADCIFTYAAKEMARLSR